MRTRTLYLVAAITLTGTLPPLTLAETQLPIEKTLSGKPGTTTRPVVKRTSRDPTNIPPSSQRFRPAFTEANTAYEIGCLYWNGKIILKFSPVQGNAHVIVRTPEGERLYRTTTRRNITINAGDRPGDYHVEVKTTVGSECTFDFTVEK